MINSSSNNTSKNTRIKAEFYPDGTPKILKGFERLPFTYKGSYKDVYCLSMYSNIASRDWESGSDGIFITDPKFYYIKPLPRTIQVDGIEITLTPEQINQIEEANKYIIKKGEFLTYCGGTHFYVAIAQADTNIKDSLYIVKSTPEEIAVFKNRFK